MTGVIENIRQFKQHPNLILDCDSQHQIIQDVISKDVEQDNLFIVTSFLDGNNALLDKSWYFCLVTIAEHSESRTEHGV